MHVAFFHPVRGGSAAGLLLLCVLGAGTFGLAAPSWAQVTDATVKGRVVDASGDILPGAVVTARHADTGARREATSDGTGRFLLAGLTPGVYTLGADVSRFRPFQQDGLRLTVGETADVTITLGLATLQESVEVTAGMVTVAVSREGRLADTFGRAEVQNLPLPQRDVFLLPKMSAGAAFIPGAANSTKLTSSPVIAVNGNRYRGNNYVLDGAMNTNPNNTGEPAIVPMLEAVEEVQVQTLNFAAEFGRGNGAVINVQTRSGTNELRGRAWEYFRERRPQRPELLLVDHAAADLQPVRHHARRPDLPQPDLLLRLLRGDAQPGRAAVLVPGRDAGAARLRAAHLAEQRGGAAAARLRGAGARTRLQTAATSISAISPRRPAASRRSAAPTCSSPTTSASTSISAASITCSGSAHRLSARWIGEHQRDEGGTSSSAATLGRALRGSRGPFQGFFGNLNVGAQQVFGRAVNDARVSYQIVNSTRGAADAVVPTVNITGITAPFGDVFESTTPPAHLRVPRRPHARARPARAARRRGSAPHHQGPGDRPADGRLVQLHDARELRRRSPLPPAADRRSGHRRADRRSRATSRSSRPASSSRISGRSARA